MIQCIRYIVGLTCALEKGRLKAYAGQFMEHDIPSRQSGALPFQGIVVKSMPHQQQKLYMFTQLSLMTI